MILSLRVKSIVQRVEKCGVQRAAHHETGVHGLIIRDALYTDRRPFAAVDVRPPFDTCRSTARMRKDRLRIHQYKLASAGFGAVAKHRQRPYSILQQRSSCCEARNNAGVWEGLKRATPYAQQGIGRKVREETFIARASYRQGR